MDYADDLDGYHPMDIRLACQIWRRGDNHRMATPGDLRATIRGLQPPEPYRITPPQEPLESAYSPEHRAEMQARMRKLIANIAASASLRGPLQKLAGESDVDQARRLWPSHERR